MFPLSTLLLENEHQASCYLTAELERVVSIVHGCLLENERVWFPLPHENERAHFPLDRVLTTLFGEATQVDFVLRTHNLLLSWQMLHLNCDTKTAGIEPGCESRAHISLSP